MDVHWTAFPLHPETPPQGRSLEDLFAGRPINIDEMLAHMKNVAEGLGLPFGNRIKTYNSRMAQELGKWAESLGKGDEFHHAIFRAYFADGRNIGNISTLIDVGKTLGLPESDMCHVVETQAFKAAVDADWARAYEMGITAVPSFMMNQQVVVGAQPYNVLINFMESNQVARRNTSS